MERYLKTVARGQRLAGAAMVLLLLATRLAAQTQPVPALPPEPAPESEATLGQTQPPPPAGAAAPARAPRSWEYELGAGGGWNSNVDFVDPNGPSGSWVMPRGGLAHLFWTPHGQLRATAAGRWTGYPNQTELSRYYADFGLEGRYRSSPHTDWRANADYWLGYSDSSRLLLAQGVLLPLVRSRSLTGSLGVTHALGRTSLRVDGRFYRTAFDSPGLIDGKSARGTIGLERPLSSRSAVAIEYSLEDVLSDQAGRSHLTHFASMQWTRILSPRSALLLEGGASYTPNPARAGLEQPQSFYGGAAFSRQVKRSSLTLFIRREVTPAFGYGVSRVALRGGLDATLPIGRLWKLRALAIVVRPEGQGPVGSIHDATDAFAALVRPLGRHVDLSGEVRYRRRGAASGIPMIEAFEAGLFVTLATPSWRAIVPWPR